MGPILLTFFALFPRALFRARWPWAIIWLPALFFVPTFSYSTFLIVYRPPQAHGNLVSGEIYNAGVRLFGLYGITSLATLAARYSSGTFDECPRCGACWDSGSGRCTHDGAALIPVPFSRTLAGRYHMEKRRGRGGTGTVYEAKDEALGRRVAVKVIREDVVCSAAAVQRFQREARAAAGFDHPNVVTVYDYGVHAGTRAFIVMELLDGATLRDELKSHGRLDAARA